MQVKYENEVKLLREEASPSLIALSDEKMRSLQEEIVTVLAEKDKELEEVRFASEKALRQDDVVFEKELTVVWNRIEVAYNKVQSPQANEVKLKREVILLYSEITSVDDELKIVQAKYDIEEINFQEKLPCPT